MTTDPQVQMDLEDAAHSWRETQRLRGLLAVACEKEASVRSAFALAVKARKAARDELDAWLDRAARPLPLFDRAPEPAIVEAPPPAPERPPLIEALTPAPACDLIEVPYDRLTPHHVRLGDVDRGLASVTAAGREHYGRLWYRADGSWLLVADASRFGNWWRNDLPGDQYSPAEADIEAALSKHSLVGLPVEVRDFDPIPADGPSCLIEVTLSARDCDGHPEAWRDQTLWSVHEHTGFAVRKALSIDCLGELAAWLEAGGKLEDIKGVGEWDAKELVHHLRRWWAENVKGDLPSWMPPDPGEVYEPSPAKKEVPAIPTKKPRKKKESVK